MVDLDKLIQSGEHASLEAKLAAGGIPNSIWESYSAFANTFGGVILLGVEEDPSMHELHPVGVKDASRMISDLWNTLNNPTKVSRNILLDRNIYNLSYRGVNIIVMEVPRAERADRPVYVGQDVFRGTYRRRGEGDYHCSRETVLSMLRDQSRETADGAVLDRVESDELNEDSIRRYRGMFRNRRPDHVWNRLDNSAFLLKIGAARIGEDGRPHPTMAGMVFFGNYIRIIDEVPDFFLDYREKMPDADRWSDRVCSSDGDWSGNVFDFYFRVYDKITSGLKNPFQLDDHSLRVETGTGQKTAIREAVANALIHADYYGRCGIVIEKAQDTITVANPGLFRLGVDAAIGGGISDARNSRIFNMFSLIDVGERSGSGLCNLYHIWVTGGHPRPQIQETLDPDRVRLILKLNMIHDDTKSSVHDAVNDTVKRKYERTDAVNDAVNRKYGENDAANDAVNTANERTDTGNSPIKERTACDEEDIPAGDHEAGIMKLLKDNPCMTTAQMAEALSVSRSTITRAMKRLKMDGRIVRIGAAKNGKWEVH